MVTLFTLFLHYFVMKTGCRYSDYATGWGATTGFPLLPSFPSSCRDQAAS